MGGPSNPRGAADTPSQAKGWPLWVVRIAFAIVFLMNVQCALQFILIPEAYEVSYGLSGPAGAVAVQGIGIAFLMWNATYPAYIASPRRFFVLGPVIVVQQLIGAVGETAVFLSLDPAQGLLSASIGRFMAFDYAGLVILSVAFALFAFAERRASAHAEDGCR